MTTGLPQEMIISILSRLPVKSVLRFRCVCKTWCELFKTPNFIQMHLNRSTENNYFSFMLTTHDKTYSLGLDEYDESSLTELFDKAFEIDYPFKASRRGVRIEAFCDGLFCLEIRHYDSQSTLLCLWNPCSREYKKIPTPLIEYPSNLTPMQKETLRMGIDFHHKYSYGFAYDHSIKDYKLVRIVHLSEHSEVNVYIVGLNAWHSIPSIPYSYIYAQPSGVLVNGALHWTATKNTSDSNFLIAFQVESEKFDEVPLPQAEYVNHISLCVSGGCLSVLAHYPKSYTDIWVMKEYGAKESWTKLVSITQQTVLDSYFLAPIHFFQNGVILLDQNYHKGLLSYDPKHENDITDFGYKPKIVPYVGSLVSLNSGAYVVQELSEEAIEQKKKHKRENKRKHS
ncbi:hypothetical protein C5167_014148 [Papaver somniferum]|uniref:F-box domain-containing protein n=1 Tax=Papaver somniferum TaxID=3469 RepID=A0A4Y7J6L3_PAPSO|nr:F-box/kelch-repeat protein At3g23880-like [Papaver somniferum]RZC55285.1 hypothetical protein C5167_014148 [Papaver somniferum]